jgi:hypothetical protein
MRFMVMHKHDWKTTETGTMPTRAFIDEMGGLIGGLLKSGAMKDGAGLGKSVNRTRLSFRNGERAVQEGPFQHGDRNDELVASYLQIETKSRAEAVAWASKLGRAFGDVEIEVGKTTEPWDLGVVPEPKDPPFHALVLVKASKDFEAGKAPSASVQSALAKVTKEMTDAGVLKTSGSLTPSAKGKRLHLARNKQRAMVDGPFAESKELIGGFCLLEMPSMEAVLDFTWRYGELLLKSVETLEIDIRPVAE